MNPAAPSESPAVSTAPNRNLAWARALFQELARGPVRHVCVCPGSRSAPLALAATERDDLRVWPHIDERSAGFFALGLAKARREPVALISTSGTAAANLLPAVVEAHYAGVPLLVLTADRPAELREWGAGQTIDQLRLYGSHVRWFAEAPLPEASDALLRQLRALAGRALAEATGQRPGPVHLNLPFREPLDATPEAGDVPQDLDPIVTRGRDPEAWLRFEAAPGAPTPELVAELAAWVAATPRGLISCGPCDRGPELAQAMARLAEACAWPLLAEPTAQLRRGPQIEWAPAIAHADLFLRDPDFASRHSASAVLRFGATPTSKSLRGWLEASPPERLVLVDPQGDWSEPSHIASQALRVDPLLLCEALTQALAKAPGPDAERERWLRAFRDADRRAARAIDSLLGPADGDAELLEAGAVRALGAALPEAALLYVSNSMPVRDLDAFLPADPRPLRVLANRGANGIDGMVSSALGAAAAERGPVVLLTGDLALLHDLGGLLAAQRWDLPLSIVVVNNDGGGIFSFLPIAESAPPDAFEACFRTPHGVELSAAVTGLGLAHERASSGRELRAALEKSCGSRATRVIEIPIDLARNVAQHREIVGRVSAALAEAGE